MLHLRPMMAADAVAVLRLNATARPGVTALDARELFRLLEISQRHRVAERMPGGVVGYLLAFDGGSAYDGEEFTVFRRMLDRPFVYVDQVAVARSERRGGVGRALYDDLEARARCEGPTTLCCEVNLDPPNPVSSAFHARLGFLPRGTLRTGDGRTVTLLVRELTRGGRQGAP